MARFLSVASGRQTTVGYRPATLADVPPLAAWHADPDISRDRDDETFTEREVRRRLEREAADAWIGRLRRGLA